MSDRDSSSNRIVSDFGANEWLVEELYEKFRNDKNSVDKRWWGLLEEYSQRVTGVSSAGTPAAASGTDPSGAPPVAPAGASAAAVSDAAAPNTPPAVPEARTTSIAPKPTPVPADAPLSAEKDAPEAAPAKDEVTPLKGMAKTLAKNMDQSIAVPTATSVRTVPAKLLIDNRIVINNHLSRSRGGKVSFTHLIGWAVIKALKAFPSQNVCYREVDGKPSLVRPAHINLGLAIDIPKPDGTRALLVPAIKTAESMDFGDYLRAYEDLVQRARKNQLKAEDFSDITVSLTNPGGIGTVHSVPRLMNGQGCIIGVGALEYPAEFQGASSDTLNKLAIGKIITLTSTYDHRVIQGAGSGEFLRLVSSFLTGEDNFYEEVFAALRIPYAPIKWSTDISVNLLTNVDKTARVQELIAAFRERGHLMADTDPLEYIQRYHPDLDIEVHGLTFWDLDREFVTGGFGGTHYAKLRSILGILRDCYCRTVGIEYMHIKDPEQRKWLQEQLERPYTKPSHDEQLNILSKLNEAEAFETFLQTKYVGQKRFSLEGGESLIPLLDAVLQGAAENHLEAVDIGMAHRGRLNVLSNIAGKTYGHIFREFEDTYAGRGSGDVKYHLGSQGVYTSYDGTQVPVYLAANPSHLEAINGVLEGIVRAKQDQDGNWNTLPILIHGDAAAAGQGVLLETMQMSQLRGYRTGGTIHVVVNNQVGFTTTPDQGRTSTYSTDVARTIDAPIFHVNGDDPETVVRVARLAFEYRQRFHRDVVIDLVCYRRRGHNEGDDPSMTQPLMYSLIQAKRSVRSLYSEALLGRGDITEEEYEQTQKEFYESLEKAFQETHNAQTAPIPLPNAVSPKPYTPEQTGVSAATLQLIGDAYNNPPAGFTVHPKLKQLLQRRQQMSREGGIDWAFSELLALGSLLLENIPVRMSGQDSRRGTFTQRHASLHDQNNDQEWLPLANLSDTQAKFWIYDSLLSEYAVVGFEYGYSVGNKDALVLWEAQFGDFANGAQIIVDEFISSAEQKWQQESGLVMLLPHGYEGAGPDHSSARIERYLQLCADNNMVVARPSTPASYFHLLRRQAYARPRKPLIVFTPKSMLRLKSAVNDIADFTSGSFAPVIDDQRALHKSNIRRVLVVSGRLYYDLLAETEKRPQEDIAIVRLEQYYPFPKEELLKTLASYPQAEVCWVQEEPENQGVWHYLYMNLIGDMPAIRNISRAASASPATGSPRRHSREHNDLINRAFEL